MEQIKAMMDEISKGGVFAEDMQKRIDAGDATGIVKAANEHGYVFSHADWLEYLAWGKNLGLEEKRNKEMAPEELDNVVGGGNGTPWSPITGACWFFAGEKQEERYGALRTECKQFACTALIADFSKFYVCGCWGKNQCVNGWHYTNGCNI